MSIDDKFKTLGLQLPAPMQTANLPFDLYRLDGQILYLSGHVPTESDGSMAKVLGKVGAEVTPEQAYEAARKVTLGMFASIVAAVGSLDRVEAWLKVFGMVNVAPGFKTIPPVINGCSDLILEVFGADVGAHTRSAVGMAELPFGVPVEIEAQLKIRL
ncbi:MAG: RidA family protein [Pseudomonadaceae bacterium]|nr:RidA family protein [Pseudomonadaceae bacterium]